MTMFDQLAEAKYKLTFPVKEYLDAHYSDGYINNTGQYVATCHRCEGRGDNGKDKFYYNMEKFKGLCQRCYVLESDGGFNTIVGLIMFTENVTYPQAIEKLKSLSVVDNVAARILNEIAKFKQSLVTTDDLEDEDYWEIPIRVEVPRSRPASKEVIQSFFNSRNPPMPLKISDLFPCYLSDVPTYENRLMFIIKTLNSKAWLAYAMDSSMQPKTLNPRGNILSYMLGGYNYFYDKEEPLLIVEGLFDLFRCMLRGYNAVCSFSDKLSIRQVALLNQTKATQLVLCYDSDIKGFGWKGMWKVVKKYRNVFSKPVYMMCMDRVRNDAGKQINTDPDNIDENSFRDAFNKRKQVA
jgi:hypothetical protein